jgi:hypothetical protein
MSIDILMKSLVQIYTTMLKNSGKWEIKVLYLVRMSIFSATIWYEIVPKLFKDVR